MVRSALIALALSLAAAPSIAQSQTELPSIPLQGVAAMVGDQPISYTDLRQRVRLLLGGFEAQPTQEIIQQITAQALEQLITESLQLQHAQEFDFELPRDSILRSVDQLAARSGVTRDELYADFANAGINPRSLEAQIQADTTWNQIMNGRFGSRIRISKDQVDDQIEQILEGIKKRQFLLSEIFLAAPDPQTQQQAIAASRQLMQQMQQGSAPFPEVARQISSSTTRTLGGDMGWLTLDTLQPEVAEAIAEATEPGLFGPIISPQGVYIMAVRNIKEPELNPEESVTLLQVFTDDNDAERLETLKRRVSTCEEARRLSDSSNSLKAVDLGTVMLNELSPQIRQAVDTTEIGSPTDIIPVSRGPSLLVTCSRQIESDSVPSRAEIREQLRNEELAMISERELRNLERRSVITRR